MKRRSLPFRATKFIVLVLCAVTFIPSLLEAQDKKNQSSVGESQETDQKSRPGANALDIGDCPETAVDLPPENDFSCGCSGQLLTPSTWIYDPSLHISRKGQIWGTYIYGYESHICNAAVHAGVIHKGKPGRILIHFVPPPPVLRGTTSNEVTTNFLPKPPTHPPFQLAPAGS